MEKEFKKLKGLFVYNPITRINKVVPALLEIKELLPPKFLAYVEAVNEWLDYQNNAEKEIHQLFLEKEKLSVILESIEFE